MSDSAIPWTPGFSVHHYLLEFAQTQVHWAGDAIQPSHLLLSPSPPAFSLSQHQGISNELAFRIRWPKDWSFSFSISPSNEYSGLISFRIDWLINLQSKGLSAVFSSTTVWAHQFFGAQPSLWFQLSHPYMNTGKSISLIIHTFVGKVMSVIFNIGLS